MPPTLLLRSAYPGVRGGAGVFDEDQTTFLESGCALVLGTVLADGAPHTARGWGLTVLASGDQVRLLLDAEDDRTIDRAAQGGRIALTGASVRTLRAVQIKGQALAVEVASPHDEERAGRYCEAFFRDITETDGTDLDLLLRMVPTGYVACTIAV